MHILVGLSFHSLFKSNLASSISISIRMCLYLLSSYSVYLFIRFSYLFITKETVTNCICCSCNKNNTKYDKIVELLHTVIWLYLVAPYQQLWSFALLFCFVQFIFATAYVLSFRDSFPVVDTHTFMLSCALSSIFVLSHTDFVLLCLFSQLCSFSFLCSVSYSDCANFALQI